MRMERTAKFHDLGYAVVGCLTLVLLWFVAGVTDLVPKSSLPSPWAVATALPELLSDSEFLAGALDTAWSTALTVLIGGVAGVILGLLVSSHPILQRPSMVVVNSLRSIPATALIPIGIMALGMGTQMKVAIGVYAVLWPILINTSYGVASTERMRLQAARSMQWSWWRRQALVVLPSAVPSILTGIRISVGIGLIVVISTELLGARTGVGTILVQYTQADRPDVVYGGVLLLGAVGALLFSGLLRLEQRLVRWEHRG